MSESSIIGNIGIRMTTGTAKLAQGLKVARGELSKFGSFATKLGPTITGLGNHVTNFGMSLAAVSTKGLLAGLAGVGVGSIGLIKLASDAEETANKFKEVFGEMSEDAFQWSDSLAGVVQRSKFGIRTMMADMQDLLKPMGFDTKQAALMSKQVTQLAIDLASFGNLSDADALLKLRSGLSGESEPLKALGINANETAVGLKLMEMGIKGGTKAASEQQKVLARLAIIQEAAGKKNAIGDAARTAGSVANSFKGLTGRIVDLGTEIGQALLPVAAEVISTLKGWIPSAEGAKAALTSIDLVGIFQGAKDWILEAAAGIQMMSERIGGMIKPVGGVSGAFGSLKEIVTAVFDVVTNFDLTWESMGLTAIKALKQVWAPVANLAHNFKSFFGWLYDAWHSSWYDIAEIVLGVLDNLGQNIRGFASEVWETISSGFDHEIDTSKFTKSLVDGIHTAIKKPEFKALLEVDTKYEDMRLGQIGDEFAKRKEEQTKRANEFKVQGSTPIRTQTVEPIDATKLIDIKKLGGESKLKQSAEKLRDDLKTPLEKFHEENKELSKLFGNGLISGDELRKGERMLRGKYNLDKHQGFAGAAELGSSEARSAILRFQTGGNKGLDAVAENTKQSANFHKWHRAYVIRQTAALEKPTVVKI